MAKKNLVIVESPAKAKTIGKYLGPDYVITASNGHVRDLPKSRLGVDIEADFTPQYEPIAKSAEKIRELQKAASSAKHVYLATDPDREGEAISWHLKELLGLDDSRTSRVTFNEITRRVVQEAIQNPRSIDQNLVDAQQARRVMDRIVGYQISPLLWRKIKRGLSAGRVQSVATRLVVEREEEIRAFVPREYWSLDVKLDRIAPNSGSFIAHYYGKDKKYEPASSEEVQAILDEVKPGPFTVNAVRRTEKQRSPAAPFITSTLQQEASRKLNMTPARTMQIAQMLYEGVEIEGEGAVGLITYMRTDSLRLSEEAIAAAKTVITDRYGAEYYPAQPRRFKSKGSAQDAHEAIRPSDPARTPESIRKSLTPEQYRLYRLIWSRFLACQMANAVYDSMSIDVVSNGHTFRANHSSMKFAGFTAVYEEGSDDDSGDGETPLPDLTEGEEVTPASFTPGQHFTQAPSRFTEATLIKMMEEKGIGRPSTYAPTITVILKREYVVKEGKNLRPTPLGEVVTGLMKSKFSDIADPGFTAAMENRLDDVADGKENWKELLRRFYASFSAEMEQAEKDLDGERIKVPAEESDEVCDLCGKKLVVRSGKFGRFLGCPGFPDCNFTKPIVIEMPGRCPKCGSRILKKTSRRGYPYYGCERNNAKVGEPCDFMTWYVPVKDNCPECGKTMFKPSGKGAKKPFCINPDCSAFVPEEKRPGYHKPKTETVNDAAAAAVTDAGEAEPAKKTAARKTAAQKTAAKKPAEKKTTTKKTAAAKKTTAKKTTAKKTTAGKTAAKKDAGAE